MSALSLRFQGVSLVILSGVMFGLMGYLGTELFYQHLSVFNMLFWRFFIAAAWLLLTSLFSNRTVWTGHSIALITKIFALSAFSYSIASALYFTASQHIGTGLAMVIFFSFPVFVTLFSWLLDDWKMNKHAFFSLTAVIVGLLLLKGSHQHPLDVSGVMFAIISALFFAAYVYGNKFVTKKMDARLLALTVCIGNAAIFLCLASFTHSLTLPHTVIAWVYLGAIGILATALPVQFLLTGLKYISPIKASILSVLEPVITLIMGFLLLHEHISSLQLIGILIILSGAIFIQFEKAAEAVTP